MPSRRSDEETTDPLYADDRNFYKVKLWTKDERKHHGDALRRQQFGEGPRHLPGFRE
jgi:hypothetical protein